MDLQQLKTFLEVCHTRHFGHAAGNLHLTQSAVSFRIRQLETQLGTALFLRHRNNLQLSVAGERLKTHAEAILASWERARQDVASQSHQAPRVSLAATGPVWTAWLSSALLGLQRALVERHWRAETLSPQLATNQLLERRLDLAVLTDPPKVDELTALPLTPLTLVLAMPAGADPAVAVQAYVQLDWGTRLPPDPITGLDPAVAPRLRTSDLHLALAFVRDQAGCALVPDTLVAGDGWQRLPQSIEHPCPLYLVHHVGHPDLASLRPVIDYLLER